jgi:hypothetical protein
LGWTWDRTKNLAGPEGVRVVPTLLIFNGGACGIRPRGAPWGEKREKLEGFKGMSNEQSGAAGVVLAGRSRKTRHGNEE